MAREEFLQKLGTFSEIYVGVLVLSPLIIVALLIFMNFIHSNIGGLSIIELMKLCIYALIPLLNIIFLAIVKGFEVEIW